MRRSAIDRYELHEFLRQRAEVKLQEHVQEEELIESRHGRYYATFLQQREISAGGNRKQSGEEITTEIGNIRAAWGWAMAGARVQELGQSLEGLWGFYDMRGWFKEGEESFGQAAERLMEEVGGRGAQKRGKTQEAENCQLKLVLGQLLTRQGWFYYRRGDYRKSKEALHVGLTTLRQTEGDVQREMVFVLGQLGLVAWYLGDYVEARSYLEASVSAGSQEAGWFRFFVDFARGRVSQALGEYEAARQLYQMNINGGRAMNELRGVTIQHICLGTVLIAEGEFAEAERLLQESSIICQEVKDPFGEALALTYWGAAADRQGQHRWAQQRHQASLEIFEEIGDRWGVALALTGIGQATCALGEYEAARQCLRQALRTALVIEAKPLALTALVGWAVLLRASRPNENRSKRASRLLKLVLDHPASTQETKDQAARLLVQAGHD